MQKSYFVLTFKTIANYNINITSHFVNTLSIFVHITVSSNIYLLVISQTDSFICGYIQIRFKYSLKRTRKDKIRDTNCCLQMKHNLKTITVWSKD